MTSEKEQLTEIIESLKKIINGVDADMKTFIVSIEGFFDDKEYHTMALNHEDALKDFLAVLEYNGELTPDTLSGHTVGHVKEDKTGVKTSVFTIGYELKHVLNSDLTYLSSER